VSSPIIEVEHLSKLYELGTIGGRTLRESVERGWYRIRGKEHLLHKVGDKQQMIGPDHPQAGPRPNTMWALKDVSFTVNEGEVLGVIGRNGAGKSTLLKLLTRITEPTSGRALLYGRVASLLEVGTGFHPELTGRENIYLSGAILGMKKVEIDRKFDEIVAFAEIESYLDTPVKRYSSGMYVRLAFAVAAHLEPEILLVDEVLAVGDAEFQRKCLGKMEDVSKAGRTVLFVSHNMTAIRRLCSYCLWVDKGTLARRGPAPDVVREYLTKATEQRLQGEIDLTDWPGRYGKGRDVRILAARLLDDDRNITARLARLRPMHLEFDFESTGSHALLFSSVISSESGERILHLSQYDTPGLAPCVLTGRHRVRFSIPALPLAEGNYQVLLGIHSDSEEPLDVVTDVLPFEVYDREDSHRPFRTIAKFAYSWTPNQCSITQLH
jgi:lipopolysaccharide transport system ATP-binding protein